MSKKDDKAIIQQKQDRVMAVKKAYLDVLNEMRSVLNKHDIAKHRANGGFTGTIQKAKQDYIGELSELKELIQSVTADEVTALELAYLHDTLTPSDVADFPKDLQDTYGITDVVVPGLSNKMLVNVESLDKFITKHSIKLSDLVTIGAISINATAKTRSKVKAAYSLEIDFVDASPRLILKELNKVKDGI